MAKMIKTKEGYTFTRVSRKIAIKGAYITKRHSLYDYGDDGDTDEAGRVWVYYFRYGGRTYALSQFLRMGTMWAGVAPYEYDDNGETSYICGYDGENYYNPLYIEILDDGETIRLYERIDND